MDMTARYQLAQEHELECWQNISAKLRSPAYQRLKGELWSRIAERLSLRHTIADISRTLMPEQHFTIADIGCGPSGMISHLPTLLEEWFPNNRFRLIGVDPLMDHYQNLLPYLKTLPVTWIANLGESLKGLIDTPVQLLLCINAIDHVKNIEQFARNLLDVVAPTGRIIISVNCHAWRTMAWLWSTFHIEALHPYQKNGDQYEDLLRSLSGNVRTRVCLDEACNWFEKAVREEIDTREPKKPRTLKVMMWRTIENLGLKRNARSENDLAIFHHYAFVVDRIGSQS